MKDIVTAEDVRNVPPGGHLVTSPGAIVTPWARELAATRGVHIGHEAPSAPDRTVALGGDHGGFALKEELKAHLTRAGWRVRDLGTFSAEPVDYPDVALAVARVVKGGEAAFGVLVDGAGIGSAMAANKVPGIRAALCGSVEAARNAREHNDANVLTLGAKFLDGAGAKAVLDVFLSARCTEERHLRRVGKIRAIEEANLGERK